MSDGGQEPKEPTGRVTQRDVYEAVRDLRNEVGANFVSKAELRLWVVLGIVGGQGVTALVTQLLTGASPAAQAAWVIGKIGGVL
jgi:hypothetical protein